VLFTADGNYTMFVDDIAACGVSGFVLEPWTDMDYVAEKYGKTHVIVGNADTRILLSGSKYDIECEVRRCIDIGRDCPGFILAVGNHIPPNTPVESALYYDECYRRLRAR
jgi:uroporphyrinogen-III decarboxylase